MSDATRDTDLLRRRLLQGALALPLLPALNAWPARAEGFRRVRPGEPGWPAPEEWQAFGRGLGGELIRPAPLLEACTRQGGGDACHEALRDLHNPYYIGDQVSGTQVSGWYGAWSPGTSAWAVACSGAADVVAAVNFARRHRLRLAVKGGGHSYQGTSNAAGSLLIWTRPMRGIAMHDAFVPQGCAVEPVPAVTVEAGAMWMDVYEAVTTQGGRCVQGGGCTTVGVAGLVQSGGFNHFSKRYGTAAGNLLQAEVVTADGALRTVNACSEPELFWGLKGGGGGSLAAVTRLTLRTHELPEFFGAALFTLRARSDAAFKALLLRFVEFYAGQLFNPHWGEQVRIHGSNRLEVQMVSQGLGRADIEQLWQPFLKWVCDRPADYSLDGRPLLFAAPARSWWDMAAHRREGAAYVRFDDRPQAQATHAWWTGDQEQVGLFLHGYESLWLPASLLQPAQREALAAALFEASRHMTVGLHFNKGLAGGTGEAIAGARDTATNPAALDAFALAIIATGGAPRYTGYPGASTDRDEPRRDAAAVDQAAAVLRKLAPEGGSYVSESNYFNPDWQRAYWGEHYPRLRAAKAKYDPEGLFCVHHGVGSEEWSADGFERLA